MSDLLRRVTPVPDTSPFAPAPLIAAPSATGGPRVRVHGAQRWSDLSRDFVTAVLSALPADPLAGLRVVVRGPAAARAVTHAVALRTGTPTDGGVCTGVEMSTLQALHHDVEAAAIGHDATSDPWRRRPLSLTVLDVLRDGVDEAWFAPLRGHLIPGNAAESRPGRWFSTADRVAGLMRRYLREAPEMVRSWSRGEDVGPDLLPLAPERGWQPEVWRACRDRIGVPDPVERHDLLVEALTRDPALGGLPDPLLILDPGPLSAADYAFLDAVSASRPVDVWMLRPDSDRSSLGARLGAGARSRWAHLDPHDEAQPVPRAASPTVPSTVLRRLQRMLIGEDLLDAPVPDRSVQLHASHGPNRQVEVLRDVLCAVFEELPDLEPRDVVVLCPDPARYAPLVAAAFGTGPEASEPGRHPGTALRVQVSRGSLASPSSAAELLKLLIELPASRAEAQDFLDLCAHPLIAERFSLDEDDLRALRDLLGAAHARWGLDAAHRARFDVAHVRQSTWLAAIDRLCVGLAMGDQPAGWLDTAAPVEGVTSQYARVIGAAAEILSRLRRLAGIWSEPATIGQWSERLLNALDDLAPQSGPNTDEIARTRARLVTLSDSAGRACALLTAGDVRARFQELLGSDAGRSNLANGSLLVMGLADLDAVEHRVVVLLGLDDGALPSPERPDGDDLLAGAPDLETSHRVRQLGQLGEAIRAARDALIVVYQGADPRTNEEVPTSPVLTELAHLCRHAGGGLTACHTLLPESPKNFLAGPEDPPQSFDPIALRGARALEDRLSDPVHPAAAPRSVRPEPLRGTTDVSEIADFLRNPAQVFVRSRLGVSLARPDDELDPDLPVEPDGLTQWSVGTRLLDAVLSGADPDAELHRLRLSGILPPNDLAAPVLHRIRRRVDDIAGGIRSATHDLHGAELPRVAHRLEIPLAGEESATVVANVRVVGDRVVSWRYGRIRLSDVVGPWLDLLALAAARPDTAWTGQVIGTWNSLRLRAPDAATARDLLAEAARLRQAGLAEIVPLPLEVIAVRSGVFDTRTHNPAREAAAAWDALGERPEWRLALPVDYAGLERLPARDGDPGPVRAHRLDQLQAWLVDPLSTALARGGTR